MRMRSLVFRSLAHHRGMHVSVGLAVATASAVMTGALVVGDSMRGSLRDAAIKRLGPVDFVVTSTRFFPADLAERMLASPELAGRSLRIAPAILVPGAVAHAEKQTRAGDVTVIGADERFWSWFEGVNPGDRLGDRRAALNDALAAEIAAAAGDDVLVRMGRPSSVSLESLLGRRDQSTSALRLTATEPVAASGLGGFSLSFRQSAPRNVLVALSDLQPALQQPNRVNALLIALGESTAEAEEAGAWAAAIDASLRSATGLGDFGLNFRSEPDRGYVVLEADSILIDPIVESAAVASAQASGYAPVRVLSYLANKIELKSEHGDSARAVPYSTVAGMSEDAAIWDEFRGLDGKPVARPGNGELLLNDWTARELAASIGDLVTLEYFLSEPGGALRTETSSFRVAGVMRLSGAAADTGFVPPYPGVTDTENLRDWNAPFPMDLSLVGPRDEAYWKDHRTTPKAFLRLDDAQRLWGSADPSQGRITSLRMVASAPESDPRLTRGGAPSGRLDRVESELLAHVSPRQVGFRVNHVRAAAIAAAGGSTDFGVLFLSFSSFILVSSAVLVVLLYRLGVERRVFEVGLLSALGFSRGQIARVMLLEGAFTAIAGAVLGLIAARGYAAMLLGGLRSWWADAVRAPFLALHVEPVSLAMGALGTVVIAMFSMSITLRGFLGIPPRRLLGGGVPESLLKKSESKTLAVGLSALMGVMSLVLVVAGLTGSVPPVAAFFGGGAATLVAGLCAFSAGLARLARTRSAEAPPVRSLFALALRNTARHPGRGVLTASLIGSASFLIVSLEAYRTSASAGEPTRRDSGTGGFPLFAQATSPLPFDLATEGGREDLGLSESLAGAMSAGDVAAFRLRPGDHASCQNLYQSSEPRILGADDRFVERGGFRIAAGVATHPDDVLNPWRLLRRDLPDGSIPVIGDEAAVVWQLKSGLNKSINLKDSRGNPVALRFVALLKGSCLQDELIIHEAAFRRLFPEVQGPGFFLIAPSPGADVRRLEVDLERDLSRFGFDVGRTAERIAGYQAVQNTYLTTFQALGGLGLALGTVGLGAVLLRNVWERRKELGLMCALGFAPSSLKRMILIESLAHLAVGLVIGVGAAILAVAPRLAGEPDLIPLRSLAVTFGWIVAVAIAACLVAVGRSLTAPPLSALRSE